jgi:hypothetical protein
MSEPKYSIGDTITNTIAYGNVKVVDIFKSPTTGNFMYLVEEQKGGEKYAAQDHDLEQYNPGDYL